MIVAFERRSPESIPTLMFSVPTSSPARRWCEGAAPSLSYGRSGRRSPAVRPSCSRRSASSGSSASWWTTRTREIGIRIALGATRSRVLRGVLVDAVKLAAWGVAGGLGLAFLWAREISWSTFGGIEPVVYAGAIAIALGVAVAALCPRPAAPRPSSRSSQ